MIIMIEKEGVKDEFYKITRNKNEKTNRPKFGMYQYNGP